MTNQLNHQKRKCYTLSKDYLHAMNGTRYGVVDKFSCCIFISYHNAVFCCCLFTVVLQRQLYRVLTNREKRKPVLYALSKITVCHFIYFSGFLQSELIISFFLIYFRNCNCLCKSINFANEERGRECSYLDKLLLKNMAFQVQITSDDQN